MAGPVSTASRSHDPHDGDSTQHAAGSPRAAAEVIAVTQRDDFLLELGEALGGQFSVRPVDSTARALEHAASARRAALLAIDSRDVPDLRGDVDRAHSHAGSIPVVVFAGTDSEKSVAATLKSSNVFAVLPIPLDKRKTAAVFEGAVADHAATRPAGRPPAAGEIRNDVRSALVPEPLAMPEALRSGGGSSRKLVVGAVAALVLAAIAGAAVWMFQSSPGPSAGGATPSAKLGTAAAPARVPAPPAVAEVPLAKGSVDELLEKARGAMRERRYTEPANDSAILYYRSALKADPQNGEAHDGMTRLASLLQSRFDDSVSANRLDDAAGALAGLKVATPGDTHLGQLEFRLLQAEVNKALAEGNLERVAALMRQAQSSNAVPADQLAKWRQEVARRQDDARLKRLADLFAERLRDGRLVEPENDGARYYLQQLESITPNSSTVQRETRDLIAAYLRKGREAALANHSSEADRWLGEARAAGLSAADASAYQKDVSTARARAAAADADRLAQSTRDRLRDGRLTEPAQDSAAFYATQLKEGYPDSSAVATLSRDLATKLLERARTAAAAGQSADADLAAARRWGAADADVQAVQLLAAGHAKSTAAGKPASVPLPPGVKLKRTRYEAPEYPQKAMDAKISGAVTVEFTVGVNGVPRDIHIIEATPPNVFDHAATVAVSRWRFEPVVINNVATEVPTRMVMRFELPK